ncbi:secreted RxLR effector protein 161-like [Helianthus annuus]|uniref:secreted RxLR effector protein 161-like n=1 Tax=Helianthus annuus TaxID=4232 RepID=UPI001652DDB8|nr:secreted RxLR effector protein 161-like [Helianthus annuus]
MRLIPYASVVGSLMYAQVCTRPDIAHIAGMLGRYQSNPGLDHWKAAKKVLRYLQGTKDYKLTYRRTDNLEVVGYSDSDFAKCKDNKKSTSGYIFMLAGEPISWRRHTANNNLNDDRRISCSVQCNMPWDVVKKSHHWSQSR